MTANLEQLLAPVSAESPAGVDLAESKEDGRKFMELEAKAQPKSGGQSYAADGSPAGETEEPDWGEIATEAADLLRRSKDLRVAQILALAWLKTGGLAGLADGLTLIEGLVKKFWVGLYPLLDTEDDDDPTERINAVNNLAAPLGTFGDPWQIVMALRRATLVTVPKLGAVPVGSLLAGRGLATALPGLPTFAGSVVDALLRDVPEAQLKALGETVDRASTSLKAIEQSFSDQTKHKQTPNLDALQKEFSALAILLGHRTAGPAGSTAGAASAPGPSAAPVAGAAGALPVGEIQTRAQVIEMLDRICSFYERHEPASPLPLLLRRARRLVGRNFLEVMSDLAPDSLTRIRDVTGAEEPEKPNS